MNKKDTILKRRLLFFITIVCLIFLYIIFNYYQIQVINNDFYKDKALDKIIRELPIKAKRGTILDVNGKKLAYSVTKFNIWVDKRDFNEENKDEVLKVIEISEETFDQRLDSDRNIIKVASLVDSSVAKIIKTNKYAGVWATSDSKRIYPYDDFASHLIGHTNVDNLGISGLEYKFNEELKGTDGTLKILTDAVGRELAYGQNDRIEPTDGQNVYLTVDEVVQFFTQKHLDKILEDYDAKRAMGVVMEVKTGKILAMETRPSYNLNEPRTKPLMMVEEEYDALTSEEKLNRWSEMWKNPIVSEVYEPGSIFKTFTAAVGLEENVVDLYSTFNEHSGYVNVHGTRIKCWVYPDSHGEETFVEALENSCNPVFVKVGQRITADKFHDYMINLGLNSKPDIMMSGVSNSLIPTKENIGPVELATMSFGHGISITPLQMITALNGLINNGNLVEPSIIEKITTVEDDVVYQQDKEIVKQVISEKTSKDLRLMLESVVNNGSGRNAYIPGIRVGGKTGTSEKLVDGQYSSDAVYSSFFGFAPVDDPEIVVLVIADEPKDVHFGSVVAAPAVKEILESTLKYRGIKPNFTN